ncbi:hypothetical protein GGE06_007534 [Streptomyces sp. SFB5A]|uniref:Uncharacterized protein n=1 Tax=Streptomyces nymphaeiformis TaxID=2663842 RepID=A0A7W7XGJ1_9ACTN|nr:hypothetical protein [Streptomyces nymphaeiformis]
MRPSRDRLRSTVGECLIRHPGALDALGALDGLLTAELTGWPR